jgi:hypothetical protein
MDLSFAIGGIKHVTKNALAISEGGRHKELWRVGLFCNI